VSSLAEVFEQINTAERVRNQVCKIVTLRKKLDPDDQEFLTGLLASDDVASTVIEDLLNAQGYDIKAQSIQRHRRGRCTCDSV